MVEIGKIFINDENKIEIVICDEEISNDILKTDSENILDKVSEILCKELNKVFDKASK